MTLPAETGEIGILPGHTPLVTLLGVGLVTYSDGGRSLVAVRGGFAEISNDAVRILADEAAAKDAIDAAQAATGESGGRGGRADVVGRRTARRRERRRAFAEARLTVAAS